MAGEIKSDSREAGQRFRAIFPQELKRFLKTIIRVKQISQAVHALNCVLMVGPEHTFTGSDYALSNWTLLSAYLHDGRLEIDNNLVENAIRPTALGKKNWLFFGEAEAGERSAILYTIIECCRRRGIDPLTYLRDVLQRLPATTNWTVGELTPQNWLKARESTQLAA